MASIWRDKWLYYKPRERQVKQGSEDGTEIIVTGDFRIDRKTRSATVRGHQVQLTAGEFDVLVFLTSHHKQVVTSRTTLSLKSETQGVRQTEFLRNLLSLRKKLEEEVPDNHYVQTEAWVLYDFDPGTTTTI